MADGSGFLAIDRIGSFDRVRLAAPERKNALSLAMLDDIAEALARSGADPASRGVVLDHVGTVFCAGVDLVERRSLPTGARDHSQALADLYRQMWRYPKPIVCRVDGAVRGGGVGLVALADVVVVSQRASFAFTEVLVGVAPALVGAIVMARVGAAAPARWLLSGRTFGAQHAVELGLATEHSDDDAAREVELWVSSLERGAPTAQRTTKELTRRFAGDDIEGLIDEMLVVSAAEFQTVEAADGMAAFADKRPPSWIG